MRRNQQQGSALVVAIFVIVVLGLLVATLSRLTVSSSDAVVTEVLGSRAYHAAQTGLNQVLMEVFPLGDDSIDAINDCSALTLPSPLPAYSVNSDPGLAQCTVTWTCEQATYQAKQYFEIATQASCGSSVENATRRVAIEVTGL